MGEIQAKEPTGLKKVVSSTTSTLKEWRSFQREIKSISTQTAGNLATLQTALLEYRLFLTGLDYKSSEVDDKVWAVRDKIWLDLPYLKKKSFKFPLFFRTRTWLHNSWKSWKDILQDQDQLLELLSQAPKELEVYNDIQITRQQDNELKIKLAQDEHKLEAASQSLEEALSETSHRLPEDEQIFLGTTIIQYQDAHQSLLKRLWEIEQQKNIDAVRADDVVAQLQKLEKDIHLAPQIANQIREAENGFANLISMNDVLFAQGKNVIPENELARTTVMLYEQVPNLWTSGAFEELQLKLQGIVKFIEYYQNIVKLELDVADRRRPGFEQGLAEGKGEANEYASMISIVRSLINAVDSRDRFMRGHSEQVARIALRTAQKMNLDKQQLEQVELAALLHDVGKLSIPESILLKNRTLSAEERRIVEKHPFFGANIIRPVSLLKEIAPLIYHHQERWDGKGYPDHIEKQEIPLISGIISVAEAYSVMTTNVPYRQRVEPEKAISEIEREAGKQFNPAIIEPFTQTLDDKTG